MLSVPIIVYRISRRVLPGLVLTGVRHHLLALRRCFVKMVLLVPAGCWMMQHHSSLLTL